MPKKKATDDAGEAKVMLAIRIAEVEMAGLHRESERLGVSVTTLARAAIRDAVGMQSFLADRRAEAFAAQQGLLERLEAKLSELEQEMARGRSVREALDRQVTALEKKLGVRRR